MNSNKLTEGICCRLDEYHAAQLKALTGETEEQRSQIAQMEKERNYLQTELEAQKEANVRSPSNTMKNLVERLKAQLTQKEKQLKVLSSKSTCTFSTFFSVMMGSNTKWLVLLPFKGTQINF